MSRLEKVNLKWECLSMRVRGSINIPEVAIPSAPLPPSVTPSTSFVEEEMPPEPFSPTFSEDSGRWTGTSLFPSSKYLVHGGPGFSIGILDSTTGSLERLPIPVPTLSFLEAADASNFSLSEITCLTLAGESQVWAGTETGSLHVFDLEPGPRLGNHGYSKLPDPVSCLRAEQLGPGRAISSISSGGDRRSAMRTEILVGSTNNTLTIISGEADERGGLRNVARCPRKVIQLGKLVSEDGCQGVNCLALVATPQGQKLEECYWCGCGSTIVVLKRSTWKVLKWLDHSNTDGLPPDTQTVTHLEPSDYGVWCAVSESPAMLLWDTKSYNLKLKISCFNAGPESPLENRNAQVTCLVYSDPLLMVGTQGGYLLVFSIHTKHHLNRTRHMSIPSTPIHSLPSSPKLSLGPRTTARKLDYSPVAAIHCCSQPIVRLHPLVLQGGVTGTSPYPLSPGHITNILAVFGEGESGSGLDSCIQLYEMISSPINSPMASPQTITGRLSTGSTQSLPVSATHKKYSLHDLDAMPKLSISRVSKGALSYLPLQDNSNR